MSKTARGMLLGALSAESDLPLYRQLYERIRDLVLDGTLSRNSRLPSSRTLAKDLGLSRNTVLLAVETLVSEEYLEARVGDGTYVRCCIPEDRERPRPVKSESRTEPVGERRLALRGQRISRLPLGRDAMQVKPFAVGIPALAEFPWETWRRVQRRVTGRAPEALLGYGDPAGYRPLREAVADYLKTARGVRAEAEQVLIVTSSQQALDLAARVLLDPGDPVWMEDPGYLGARGAFQASGAELVAAPVDGEGLDVERAESLQPNARLAYVTPSHQFPLGSVLSLQRRLALLDWAARRGSWIVEDDYDSEFRYAGRPLPALQGLDRNRCVIYVGTFSKVIFPSLRVAYLVPPADLVKPFLAARAFMDRHSSTLPQTTLAEFFRQGHFTAHIRRMRSLYDQRRRALRDALSRELGNLLRVREDGAGLHLVAELPPQTDDEAMSRRLSDEGILASPLSRACLGQKRRGLVLGYAALSPAEIEEAVRRMREVLSAEQTLSRSR